MVRTSVEQHGAQVVIIDSLNGFLQSMSGEHMLVSQMHELLTYLSQRGVTTLLVLTQSGLLGTHMQAPVDLSYLSDNVLLLRYFEAEGRVRKAVSVLKKRSGQHEDAIRELLFSPSGIEVGERLEKFHGVLTGVPTLVSATGPSSEVSHEREE
jgi:circadian clock protein KaiC